VHETVSGAPLADEQRSRALSKNLAHVDRISPASGLIGLTTFLLNKHCKSIYRYGEKTNEKFRSEFSFQLFSICGHGFLIYPSKNQRKRLLPIG